MDLEKQLYQAAISLIEQRYPTGEGGAAALRTASGTILTSVAPETKNEALSLCIEVGACLEAHKLDEVVTHSLCVYREWTGADYVILSPCGICSERLAHWGGDVRVAISNPQNKLQFKALREMLPHHWSQVNGLPL